jgi:hypothetical protein
MMIRPFIVFFERLAGPESGPAGAPVSLVDTSGELLF